MRIVLLLILAAETGFADDMISLVEIITDENQLISIFEESDFSTQIELCKALGKRDCNDFLKYLSDNIVNDRAEYEHCIRVTLNAITINGQTEINSSGFLYLADSIPDFSLNETYTAVLEWIITAPEENQEEYHLILLTIGRIVNQKYPDDGVISDSLHLLLKKYIQASFFLDDSAAKRFAIFYAVNTRNFDLNSWYLSF